MKYTALREYKKKFQEKYKENLFLAVVSGGKNAVCFRNMANWIIIAQWNDNKIQNGDDEANFLIKLPQK